MSRGLNIICLVGLLVCITSALRFAPPRRCTNGITGTCTPGGKCKAGSYCSTIRLGRRRLCCRTKPRPVVLCPFGSTGSCGGKKGPACGKDSCKLPVGVVDGLGKCCRLRPLAPKKLCPWGSTGKKCTITNKNCDKGSSCRFPMLPIKGKPSPFGECCKNRPVITPGKLCPWGSTGKCTRINKKCDSGSSCRFPLLPIKKKPSPFGACCRNRPIINLPVCRWGSVGRCGGKGKYSAKCPPGSSCKIDTKGDGHCCNDRPIIKPPIDNVCKYGSIGLCGKGIPPCRKGSTCHIPKLPLPGRLGRCCRDKPVENDECKDIGLEQDGICGGIGGLKCRPGTTCMFKDPPIIRDGAGKCCGPKKPPFLPVKKVCPPSLGLPGICVELPNSCLNDKQCGKDELCCDQGCGKVCKKAVMGPVLKLPTS